MKKLLLLLAFLSTATLISQNIEEEKVRFTKVQLPLEPLAKTIKTFHATVSTPYSTSNENILKDSKEQFAQKKAHYPESVKEAEAKYQEDLKLYDQRVIDARKNFQLESDEFKKLSMVERMALADKKPELHLPAKPYYQKPSEPVYYAPDVSNIIVFSPEVLANSYINLHGFERADNADVKIEVTFHGFEAKDVETKVIETKKYDSNLKREVVVRSNQYIAQYKHPTTLKLTIKGKQVFNGIFGETGNFVSEVSNNGMPNMLNIEKQIVENTMLQVNSYLNNLYGFEPIRKEMLIYYVKNKKKDYNDLEEAKDLAVSGYDNYSRNVAEASKDLQSAMAGWEAVLKLADYADKKARIDEKVATKVLSNLINTAFVLDDFPKAQLYINQYKALKLNFSERENLEEFQRIYRDLTNRANAQL
ncbi:MAG TPA: hypothetical protein VF581_00205 [Flavobacterium sp.]|jgi:hypothetical protein